MKKVVCIELILLIVLLVVGCAKKNNTPPEPPQCYRGVNTSSCSAEVLGHSIWKWRPMVKVTPQFKDDDITPAKNTKLTQNEPSKNIVASPTTFDVYREFLNDSGVNYFRNYITVRTAKHTLTSIEEGVVQKLSNNQIEMIKTRTSCDSHKLVFDQAYSTKMYYLRHGNNFLQIEKSPIVVEEFHSLSEAIGSIFTMSVRLPIQAVVDSLTQSLRSLVGMNIFLSDSFGSYVSVKISPEMGDIGCFYAFNQFERTSHTFEPWQ